MIYAFVRVMVARRAEHTGRSMSDCFREVIEAVKGVKFAHPGDRPACRVCLSPKTTTTSTTRDESMVYRGHRCQVCGWTFQTFQAIEKEPPPVVETTKHLLTTHAKLIIEEEGPRKRPSRKRKR